MINGTRCANGVLLRLLIGVGERWRSGLHGRSCTGLRVASVRCTFGSRAICLHSLHTPPYHAHTHTHTHVNPHKSGHSIGPREVQRDGGSGLTCSVIAKIHLWPRDSPYPARTPAVPVHGTRRGLVELLCNCFKACFTHVKSVRTVRTRRCDSVT